MKAGLDASGRLVTDEVAAETAPLPLAERLTQVGEERVFVLHRPEGVNDPAHTVYLSQRDIRELQFAKAAIATGWTLLLEEQEADRGDVQQVLLAGSFGSYLSPASAVRIGLVPDLSRCCASSARATSRGRGAKMALLSLRERAGGAGAGGGGALRRALRPCRLQRPVRRPARVPLPG